MKKKLVIAGVISALSIIVTSMGDEAMAKNNQSNKGNYYGWTMSNGNHYGLIKQGKLKQKPTVEMVTYSAEEVVTSRKTINENQTIIFDKYQITLNGEDYTVTKNSVPFASGSAVNSTLNLIYEPAGNYFSLEVFNNTTSYNIRSIPLMLAFIEDDFTSQIGLRLGLSNYGNVLYVKGHYVRWDKSVNRVTIEKDGTVVEEYHSPTIEDVKMEYYRSTGITGLYINGELVYTF